jgi:hypothetical protein
MWRYLRLYVLGYLPEYLPRYLCEYLPRYLCEYLPQHLCEYLPQHLCEYLLHLRIYMLGHVWANMQVYMLEALHPIIDLWKPIHSLFLFDFLQ